MSDSFTVEFSEGVDYPEIEDDMYEAVVADVSEWVEEPNIFKKKPSDPDFNTRCFISWELTSGDLPDNCPPLRQYINKPQKGFINEKSGLYQVLVGLGIPLEGKIVIDPQSWQGAEARVMVETPRDKDGIATGWPRIKGVKPKRAKREPVGAGSRKRGAAAVDEE